MSRLRASIICAGMWTSFSRIAPFPPLRAAWTAAAALSSECNIQMRSNHSGHSVARSANGVVRR